MKKFHQRTLDETFISSKVAFAGRLLKVNIDTVTLPNGRETTRELIHHPGAVAVVPILDDGSMVFVKQYRYPLGTVLYEIPAGKLDPDEDPDVCARRELSEETGYSAREWQKLTSIVTTPGFTDEVIHLYAAHGLEKHAQHTDEDEFIDVVALTPQQVKQMVLEGTIYDSKTLSALCLLELLK
ncbi:NUDIX domain-containing protein [uncultured Phascolarctobacterium sp.]|uniref:NUDIX domain-containing protein n=1 Tax=uncultured Phascolarctobacterium sp. TaxID=512296 RepID=UPI0027D9325A|nr:NUDIX domain-containing protein [uncultured Phascolarctobacterium sp.]